MPNLAPMNQPKKPLKDDWFQLVPNPDDPKDTGLCIQMLRGPFSHVILKYQNFKTTMFHKNNNVPSKQQHSTKTKTKTKLP